MKNTHIHTAMMTVAMKGPRVERGGRAYLDAGFGLRGAGLGTVLWVGLLAGLSGQVGCQGVSEADGSPTPAADVVTYEQVAPFMARSCVSCHQPGGVAPFSLATYEDARKFAAASNASVQSGSMPPLYIVNDGSCQTFDDKRFLTTEEKQLLASWVESGALRRDPGYRPPAPEKSQGLPDVSITLDMGQTYTPQGSNETPHDDYRCFFVDPVLDQESFMAGYEVVPGDPRVVHHIILMSLSDEDEAKAEALEAQDERPGWSCLTGAGEGISYYQLVLAWAPGSNVETLPEGMGLKIPAGRRLVMQMHYNLLNGSYPDRTRVKFDLKDSVDEEVRILLPGDFDFELQPGLAEETISYRLPLAQIKYYYEYSEGTSFDALKLLGAAPHMHLLGRKQRLSVVEGTSRTLKEKACLAETDRYDFNWQLTFFYQTPVQVSASDDLFISCTYDTTSRTEPVHYGETTEDEMCLTGLYAVFED